MEAIHVVGAGGIGCAVGYALCATGNRVVFVESNPEKVEAGRREGVRVDNRPALHAEFVHFRDWQPGRAARVLLCTKCYDNAPVLARLPGVAQLIPIQNGFDSQLDSHGHTLEGIASFVSECAPDRPHTRITRKGPLYVGSRHVRCEPQASTKSDSLRGAANQTRLFPLGEVARIESVKYAKLMYNAAISPLAAAAGIDNGKLLSVPQARALFFALLQENYRILRAAGVELGKVGPFHPRTVAWILRRKALSRVMAKFFEPSLRGTYCSMAGEIQKGRTEIDNYNGHLIQLAEEAGAPCDWNRAVYDLVTRMTTERAEPRREVLRTLASGGRKPPDSTSHQGAYAPRSPGKVTS